MKPLFLFSKVDPYKSDLYKVDPYVRGLQPFKANETFYPDL